MLAFAESNKVSQDSDKTGDHKQNEIDDDNESNNAGDSVIEID